MTKDGPCPFSERMEPTIQQHPFSLSPRPFIPTLTLPGGSKAEQFPMRLAKSPLAGGGCLASQDMGRGILGEGEPAFCPSPRARLRATWDMRRRGCRAKCGGGREGIQAGSLL